MAVIEPGLNRSGKPTGTVVAGKGTGKGITSVVEDVVVTTIVLPIHVVVL